MRLYGHQTKALEQTAAKNKVAYYLENYHVTSDGKVYSKRTGKELKQTKHNGKQPYFYVTLCRNGKSKKCLVHRLVAITFIPNPDNKPQVNHIDGNVHNNDVTNLEWVTNAQNTQHAYDTFLNTKRQLHIKHNGEIHSLRKWCMILNLPYKAVWYQYHNGLSFEDCIERFRKKVI